MAHKIGVYKIVNILFVHYRLAGPDVLILRTNSLKVTVVVVPTTWVFKECVI